MPDSKTSSTVEDLSLDQLSCTGPSPCQYLPGKIARVVGFLADGSVSRSTAEQCIRQGFRRSGLFVYRPACPNCQSCIPVRIRVDAFQRNRTQRRLYAKHQAALSIQVMSPVFNKEHFSLYCRYLMTRHPDSEMRHDLDASQYRQFMLQSPINTALFEFRDRRDGEIRIISVVDLLDDGLSAVYTAYDPDHPQSSWGIFSILWQIELARSLDKDHLYLGYYVAGSPKMAYKKGFSALEAFIDGRWKAAVDI